MDRILIKNIYTFPFLVSTHVVCIIDISYNSSKHIYVHIGVHVQFLLLIYCILHLGMCIALVNMQFEANENMLRIFIFVVRISFLTLLIYRTIDPSS